MNHIIPTTIQFRLHFVADTMRVASVLV